MRVQAAAAGALLTMLLAACGGHAPARTQHALGRTRQTQAPGPPRDPPTRQALLHIARQFNADYAANRAAAVYDRWDAKSRTIISRTDYIHRHEICRTGSGPGFVQDAARRGGWWLVHYSISGVSLTDYWSYQHGRWVFDLFRSNPQAVGLYRLPFPKYRAAVGCSP